MGVALADRVLSRRKIEGLIADGKALIIYDGQVLCVNSWIKFHPGGDKAILHMVGRDATDEINALHSAEARKRMQSYIIGKIQGHWDSFVAPIHGGFFRPYNAENEQECHRADGEGELRETLSSSTLSRSPSPSIASEDSILRDPSVRRRRGTDSSLASSVSSVFSASSPNPSKFDAETLTQQQILRDLEKYPALDNETQRSIVQKYRELQKRISQQGLYQCRYSAYARECVRYVSFLIASLICLKYGWFKMSAVFMGCFWHQLTFTAHDAGHMGITHNFQVDSCIGIFIANFLGGLSLGWWKLSHNVHHIVTNDPEHDPDIEHLPFFAVSHRFFSSLYSTYYNRVLEYDAAARFLVRFQNYLYYPILFFGRFNLYRLSWEYLLLGLGPRKGVAAWHRYLELSGMIFFWYWFGYGIIYKRLPTGWDRIIYLIISHGVTSPLHVQITLSHFAMSTADLGAKESFPQKMLRTTMDVDCPEWLDFFHGGLQFQAIHHLYPRIPRHNLRQTQKLVIEFCNEVRIPYTIYGFYDGNKETISHLREIARQATYMAECQATMVQKGEYGHF